MGVLEQPGAVGLPLRAQHLHRFGHARVRRDRRRLGSTPGHAARRSASGSETRTAARPGRPPRRCSCAGTAPRSSRYSSPRRRAATDSGEPPVARSCASSPSSTLIVVANDERTDPVLRLAVPAAVVELLAEQPGDDAVHVLTEVGAERDCHAVDARLHLAVEERLAAVLPAAVVPDQRDGPARLRRCAGRPRSHAAAAAVGVAVQGWPCLGVRRAAPGRTRRPPTGRRRPATRAGGRPSPRWRPVRARRDNLLPAHR